MTAGTPPEGGCSVRPGTNQNGRLRPMEETK
jgi:hypothetical protein